MGLFDKLFKKEEVKEQKVEEKVERSNEKILTTIWLNKEDWKKLKIESLKEGRNASAIVRELIRRYLEEKKTEGEIV